MKKVFSLVLVLILIAGLCACAPAAPENPVSEEEIPSGASTDLLAGTPVSDKTSSLPPAVADPERKPWEWEVGTGMTVEHTPFVALDGVCYYPRRSDTEVVSLSDGWEYVGEVEANFEGGGHQYTQDGDEKIVSNRAVIGSKVYRWRYLVAVEYEGSYGIFTSNR